MLTKTLQCNLGAFTCNVTFTRMPLSLQINAQVYYHLNKNLHQVDAPVTTLQATPVTSKQLNTRLAFLNQSKRGKYKQFDLIRS